jgi:tRNA threonylcarbamoyladenosine biosynthesis protein TsaB
MLVLALDTTTRPGSVALMRDDAVLDQAAGDAGRTHAEQLPAELAAMLARQGLALADVDLFGVAAGPGSFTGLRIGVATIQGLAFALGKPVAAVSVLDALADLANAQATATGSEVAPLVAAWMDAQRHEVFAALYRPGPVPEPMDGPWSAAPATVLDRWRDIEPGRPIVVAGDGIARYREVLQERLGERLRTVEPLPILATTIARLAARDARAGRAGAPHAVHPVYVRKPDAELARDRKR